MTGKEALIQRYQERFGVTQAAATSSINSNGVQRVLTILAEEQGLLSKVVSDEIERKTREAQSLMTQAQEREATAREKIKEADWTREELYEQLQKSKSMYESLQSVETVEAKDRVRLLQIYKDTVDVQTPQNNTAFIAGCAAILSGTQIPFSALSAPAK